MYKGKNAQRVFAEIHVKFYNVTLITQVFSEWLLLWYYICFCPSTKGPFFHSRLARSSPFLLVLIFLCQRAARLQWEAEMRQGLEAHPSSSTY